MVTPGPVGWTRVAVTVTFGCLVAAFALIRLGEDGVLVGALAFAMGVVWAAFTWMRLHITVLVDEHGITPSLGGFWPRKTWPASNFRTVQLRRLEPTHVGGVIGQIGLHRGRVIHSTLADVTALPGMKVRTFAEPQVDATYAVTTGGVLVEIVRHDGGVYLLSPKNPEQTAQAVAKVIQFRR